MLLEADQFLSQVELGEISVAHPFFRLASFKKKVEELRAHRESRLAAMRFFVMSRWMPSIAGLNQDGSASFTDLRQAFSNARMEAIRQFLTAEGLTGEDINHPELFDYSGPSLRSQWPLLEEVATGMSELVDLALEKGADPNFRSSNEFGNTPLTWSIANDAKRTALELVMSCKRRGIALDLNRASQFNENTPLILSVAKGHERPGQMPNWELTQFLLDQGADPNRPDALGNTALHYAFLRRDLRTVQLLLAHRAELGYLNHRGESPGEMLDKNYEESRRLLFQITFGHDQGSCSFDFYGSEFRDLTVRMKDEFGSKS
jgi:hypothetical protein